MILICSAWQEEIKKLKESSNLKDEVLITCLGIGYLDAAINLERFLSQNPKPQELIFIGTAGAYSQELNIGDLVNVCSVALLNIGSILKQSYIPKEYESFKSCSKPKTQGSMPAASCLSSLEITTNAKLSEKISKLFPATLVENMELYGLAKVANQNEIPWSALLGVTNYTNENAHQDWKSNHLTVSEKLCDFITNTNLLHN